MSHLYPGRSYEAAFRRAVLITYEAFTTSNRLFDLITDQYSLEPARELSEDEFIQWKEARLRPTQVRWVTYYVQSSPRLMSIQGA